MPKARSSVPNHNRLLLLAILPFPLTIVMTFAAMLLVGERYPRQVASGSSLSWWGLGLSLTVFATVLLIVRQHWSEAGPRRFALALSGVTSLLAWPVWTTGILPSINGAMLGPHETSMMQVEKLTTSRAKGNRIYHWATLRPLDNTSPIGAGRYFVPQDAYQRWQERPAQPARVIHAKGLLGARIAIAFR
jgi:hypothetical protein